MGAFETMKGQAETPRNAVIAESRLQQEYLSGEVEQPLQRKALDFANALPSLRTKLADQSPDVQEKVEAIVAGLLDPRPAFGEEPNEALNRYLTWRTVENGENDTVYIYRIRPDVVKNDLAFLEKLKGVQPELAPELSQVQMSLNEYARRDAFMVGHDLGQARKERFAAEAAREMGKTGGFIAASFAAAVMGGVVLAKMIRNKSFKDFSFAPVFYGGVAALLGSGTLRAAVTGDAGDRALTSLDSIINKSSFNQIARDNGIQGKEWSVIVDGWIDANPERDELFQKLKDKTATQADIDTHIASMTTNGAIRAQLDTMVKKGDYERMVQIVSKAADPASRTTLEKHVLTGAWKYAK